MSELPSGWARTTLGTVADWGAGGTPSRSEPNFYGGKIPWIKSGELNSRYIKTTEESITEEAIKSSSAKIFPAGSVAIAMYGATIGKTAILGIDASTNQACAVGVPVEGLIGKEYLYRLLQNEKAAFIDKGKGGAQPNISQAVIKAHEIGLPPLAEQTRIAVKLDELLAQVDTLKTRIDGIPPLLKRFRQSVLAAAVSGRLTKEWRVAVRETSQDQGFLYPVRRLGVIARFIDYRGKTPEKVDSGVPLITAKNIKSGYISRVPREFIRPEAYESWMTRGIPKIGDVLITTEAPLGNVAVIDITGKFALAQRAICLQFHEGYSSSFAAIALQSSLLQEELARRSTGTTVKGIKASVLKEIGLPAPSIDEQNEIVHRVEQLFAYAEQLETKVSEAKKRIDHLAQSILAKAFKGDLVPQDPNDEPADMLLERIKTQRTAAPKAKRSRRSATAD
ncbi:restriction endonuclease subunit S [Pseudomonas sp. GD03860]|uniref:restriction endonuclease subunit S n=1 Tax=Pseudomonas TaxID=286 RepID=UPI00236381E6|nr:MULTISPECIES: restriction endonuclease subunit S [Pseudomonas]MDD2057262.1 restriction endonuclease subunit S [Pseudomonas putida]MDH0640337.1 restriction endonuclease subunit S [Pseudomonas sp. GD03860]